MKHYLMVSPDEFEVLHAYATQNAPCVPPNMPPINWLAFAANMKPHARPCNTRHPMMLKQEQITEGIDVYLNYARSQPSELGFKVWPNAQTVLNSMKRTSKQEYLKFNNYAHAVEQDRSIFQQLMFEQRSGEGDGFELLRGVQSMYGTTLLLFGRPGSTTPFHFDWSEAKNVALGWEVSWAV